jgi:hypothetical protein
MTEVAPLLWAALAALLDFLPSGLLLDWLVLGIGIPTMLLNVSGLCIETTLLTTYRAQMSPKDVRRTWMGVALNVVVMFISTLNVMTTLARWGWIR